MNEKFAVLDIKDIVSNPLLQFRVTPYNIGRLAADIREKGQQQPILVRKTAEGRFQVLGGHSRLRALRKLKERHVKAMVYEHISDQEALARAWADNAQREDLTPYDHVQAALRLQRSGMTNEEIGRILGDEGKPLSERSVQRYVAVALLPEPFQKALRENRLTIQQTYESGRRGVPAKKAIGQPVSKLRQYARKDRSEQPDIRVWRRRDGRIVIRGEFRPGVSDADLHVREANDYVREVLARKASDSVTDAKGQQV